MADITKHGHDKHGHDKHGHDHDQNAPRDLIQRIHYCEAAERRLTCDTEQSTPRLGQQEADARQPAARLANSADAECGRGEDDGDRANHAVATVG